jgi:hypothetical protein
MIKAMKFASIPVKDQQRRWNFIRESLAFTSAPIRPWARRALD